MNKYALLVYVVLNYAIIEESKRKIIIIDEDIILKLAKGGNLGQKKAGAFLNQAFVQTTA